ncbi:hypothetical protein P167DRAFT_574486 [Morchella conica CCBAS932]|uniref:Azaphilone pigments biosynthesis cluster protein L N-terminal domain-containing protein n=1 Tax=Morchella conica CCBAS932 TaxID=1392247 RepID=A0A3N4KSP6_9PEZI|nr:hypothetical protein P167DRAFT_574486 [Morchella conica CCBAS932]
MADPLSLAASVAGLIALASQLSTLVCDAISRARSASSDITSLGSELSALCVALANLQTAINLDDLSNNPRFPRDDLSNVLNYIMKDFILLRSVVSKTIGDPAESVLTRWRKRVNWVFSKAEVEGLRTKLEAYKTTLLITITTTSLLTTTGTSEDIQDLRSELQQLSERLEQCMMGGFLEPESQRLKGTTFGSTVSGITLRRRSSTITTCSRSSNLSPGDRRGEASGTSDRPSYAASVCSDRSVQSQLNSIYAISQPSMDSLDVPWGSAATLDRSASELAKVTLPEPEMTPEQRQDEEETSATHEPTGLIIVTRGVDLVGIYRNSAQQKNTKKPHRFVHDIRSCAALLLMMVARKGVYRHPWPDHRDYPNSPAQGVHAVLPSANILMSLWRRTGTVPRELFQERILTLSEVKSILVAEARNSGTIYRLLQRK